MNSSSPFLFWTCPVCHESLTRTEMIWRCSNNHSFDIAKSGYINLLLAHHKASKQPGDSHEMLTARRNFLAVGHFMPIVTAISNSINEFSAAPDTKNKTLLDIGCGEGFYLRELRKQLATSWVFGGLDIAKDGIQMAAKQDKNVSWVCASNARLPVMSSSIDVLLRVFAPSDPAQCSRVLNDDGLLVIVSPAANHLYEIKEALYENVKLHQRPSAPEGFETIDEKELCFKLTLEQKNDIHALLRMTPFFWCGNADGRERLLNQNRLDVQVAVWISCYRKAKN